MNLKVKAPPDTELRAAETILEKGVRVQIPAPFFFFRKRQISAVIHEPPGAALFTIASIILRCGIDVEEILKGEAGIHRLIASHMKPMYRILAILFLRTKWKRRLLTHVAGRWLMNRLPARKAAELLFVGFAYAGYEHFSTSIRLIAQTRITMPKTLSPDDKGS
jgi:hypothetical protein